jgi:hypothetical protein
VQSITFALLLEGQAVRVDGDRLWVASRQSGDPASACRNELGGIGEGSAYCRRQFELWDDGSFVQTGELDFGAGDAVTFRARGSLGDSPDPERRHGTAVLEVTGGRGRLVGARGYVTPNFLLADSGELRDHQLGLLFVGRDAMASRGVPKEERP